MPGTSGVEVSRSDEREGIGGGEQCVAADVEISELGDREVERMPAAEHGEAVVGGVPGGIVVGHDGGKAAPHALSSNSF